MATRNQEFAPVGQYAPYHLNVAQATAVPVGAAVATTSSTAVAAPGSATVTVANVQDARKMRIGMILAVSGGTGTAEEVAVTALDPVNGTFTAVFANTHSGTYNIVSKNGVWLGAVIINGAGSAMTLTLYNGNPAISAPNVPGYGAFAVISPVAGASLHYDMSCDYGLYLVYTGTTVGDVTIGYLTQPF